MPVISTNTAANSAVRYLNINSAQESSSLAKLASGSRINKASDDAAGLAISTRIKSDVSVLQQAATNASHGILRAADRRRRRLADQRHSEPHEDAGFGSCFRHRDRHRTHLHQRGIFFADGRSRRHHPEHPLQRARACSTAPAISPPASASWSAPTPRTPSMSSSTAWTTSDLGIDALDVSTQAGATTALSTLDDAIDTVSSARADIGATMSRFEFRSEQIATSTENLESGQFRHRRRRRRRRTGEAVGVRGQGAGRRCRPRPRRTRCRRRCSAC